MLPPSQGTYVGHLGRIPLYVEWSALLLLYLVYLWSRTPSGEFDPVTFMIILIVMVAGIILHELGHGWVQQFLGSSDVTITITALGGVCHSNRQAPPIQRILIHAAGPAMNLLLAGVGILGWLWLLHSHPQWLAADGYDFPGFQAGLFPTRPSHVEHPGLFLYFVYYIFIVNLILGVLNILPIYPMDGGQIVYNATLAITRIERLARRVALVLTVVGSCLALGYWLYPDYSMDNLSNNLWNVMLLAFLNFQAFNALSWD